MLKQLARLSIEADGRYATDQELKFISDYLQSVESRVSAYEKIRDAAENIIEQVKADKQARNNYSFYLGPNDRSETCLRDMPNVLRCSASAMLINDLDRMREGVLIWYQTIVRAFGYEQNAKLNYQILENIVRDNLSPEEAELMMPVLQLNYTILSS